LHSPIEWAVVSETRIPDGRRRPLELADQAPDASTMVVFYRGLHCPVCQAYLRELGGKAGQFRSRGVEPVAVSGDARERAGQAKREWEVDGIDVGYGLSIETMREWGLFVSAAITDDEPPQFGEPGLFLIAPHGSVFYEAINSMAFGRPKLDEILAGVDFVAEHDYPARGAA